VTAATLLSEWTKFRSQRGTVIALAAMCALMIGMTAFLASEAQTDAVFAGDDDVVQLSLAGVVFAALAAVVVGASLITSEYSTRMIRTTLTATQGRAQVLAAKAVVLGVITFPFALAASVLAFALAQPLLHDGGYVAPAYPPVSITDLGAMRAVTGTALLLTAYCLIALGLGTIIRHSGATIATAVAVVFVPILMLGAFPQHIRERIEQFTPLAGMAVQSTTGRMLAPFDGGGGMPIGPWQGLGGA
jgi:ABC-2 type transport system permease protein